MNEFVESLLDRRSCRDYIPAAIKPEQLQAAIEVGLYAPSGMNRQATKMVVVSDSEIRDNLSKIDGMFAGILDGDPFYGAPTVVVVLSDSTTPTWFEDGVLVMGNLMHGANAVGLGSCWIHRAKETMETPYGQKLLKEWGIDPKYKAVAFCILGYPMRQHYDRPERKEDRVLYIEAKPEEYNEFDF